MRCISLGHNEFLVYDDIVASFFDDYHLNKSIHRVENRKLTDDEIKKLLDVINKIDEIDLDHTDEDYAVLNNIAKFYPEVKYFIHGLKITTAEPDEDEARKERMKKEAKDATKKRGEEKVRQKKVTKEEEKLSKSGKPEKSKFTGFKGLLFNVFKNLRDPETVKERERLKKEIQKYWKIKPLLDQNKDLVEALGKELEKGTLTPASLAAMNEMFTRDKSWVNEIDFEIDKPFISMPLEKFSKYLDATGDIEPDELQKQMAQVFRDEGLGDVKFKLDLIRNVINVKTDWNTAMKVLNTFDIKVKDLKKPIR
jgi:hypothetical protein